MGKPRQAQPQGQQEAGAQERVGERVVRWLGTGRRLGAHAHLTATHCSGSAGLANTRLANTGLANTRLANTRLANTRLDHSACCSRT